VAVRSEAWVWGQQLATIAGSNPSENMTFVCCNCCVLSGTGLCDELITHPEESYRLQCAVVCEKLQELGSYGQQWAGAPEKQIRENWGSNIGEATLRDFL
jgi:hypothetical protein